MAKQHPDNFFLRPKFVKWLLIGSAVSFILVYVFSSSLFVRPLYRAEAVIFVPLTLFYQQFDQQGIGFASDVEIDGHIQMLQSTRLLDSLAENHDLGEIYSIDRHAAGGVHRLHQQIRSRVNIEKTRYNSVSVQVTDRDPARAAAMANDIVRLGDVIKEDLLLKNRLAAYAFARDLYEQKLQEVDLLEEKMRVLDSINNIRPVERHFVTYREQLSFEALVLELGERRSSYETIQKSLDVPLPQSYVVSAATEPYRAAWPPRLILAIAAAVLFAVLFIAIELIRKDVKQA